MFPLGFAIEADGKLLLSQTDLQAVADPVRSVVANGSTRTATLYRSEQHGIEINHIAASFPGLDLVETWVEVRNRLDRDVRISRVDTVHTALPADRYTLFYYRSDWGKEFTPTEMPLRGTKVLECTDGRSSRTMMPWFNLRGESGRVITGAVAWSGNWIVRMEPAATAQGQYVLSAGLNNWEFYKDLKPGETMESPHVLLVGLEKGDLVDSSIQFARWGRRFGYAYNTLSRKMPVEWNHWWPYEDGLINEDVVKKNAAAAKEMGFEICTLDAGWFGPSEEKSEWYRVRGDWHLVNSKRFPSGIPALSKDVHGKGLDFGIWCEIEALGDQAELARLHPEYVARRNGRHMGYVCMGNPQVQDWAFGVVEKLIKEYSANWIKFDFNLDPGEGCNRTDHGHGAGDGLYEHYRGYYALLDRIRAKYPEVVLENCSSGGLRIDLGVLQHLHYTFLSDPDYTDHALQLTWGASTMLHPSAMLRFTWSQCRDHQQHNRRTDPLSADAPQHRVDYIIRAGMVGILGMSYRLPDLPPAHRQRIAEHIAFYRQHVRDLMRDGDLYALTGQPNRDGSGERWPAFAAISEAKDRAVLFVFRMTGGDASRKLTLRGLDPAKRYSVALQDRKQTLEKTGAELMSEGLTFDNISEEGSEAVVLQAKP